MIKSEDFAKLSTEDKWRHIAIGMKSIQSDDTTFSLRRRMNPHHTPQQKREESRAFRISQYSRWSELKDLYAEFRDELSNTQGREQFEECKSILERIFTVELDDALKSTLEE